jgi:hypothetical protein
LLLVYCRFSKLSFGQSHHSGSAFLVSFSSIDWGLRQDNLGPPLVHISATTLLFVSFLFVTVAARHLLRSTCLRFPPPPSRRWANYPTTFTFIGVLGSLFAPLLFRLEAVKPPVPFYPSHLAIWISASPFHSFLSRLLFFTASQRRLLPTALSRQ